MRTPKFHRRWPRGSGDFANLALVAAEIQAAQLQAATWPHLSGAAYFTENTVVPASIAAARVSVDDWGMFTIFKQAASDSGTLAAASNSNASIVRWSHQINASDANIAVNSAAAGLLNSTVTGPFGVDEIDFSLVQFDHGGSTQVVSSWTRSTGEHANGSFTNGSSTAPNEYAIGAWLQKVVPPGPSEFFKGAILAHVFWNSGTDGQKVTAGEALAVQNAINAPGTVLSRVTAAVTALRAATGVAGSKTKLAIIFNGASAVPLVGPAPVPVGTITYRAIGF